MKRVLTTIIIIIIAISANIVYAQKNILKVEIENLSLRMPDHWLINKTEKKMLDFRIRLYNEEDNNSVSIRCIKHVQDQEAAIINASSEKSLKPGFEYMIIEKVKTQKLNKYKGKFVEYTNSPLRDYFRGGFYGIIDNGYTYIIEYYSADTPEDRQEVAKILKSLKILKPESRPNFFEVEKIYQKENVAIEKPEEETLESETNDTPSFDIENEESMDKSTNEDNEDFIAQIDEPAKEKKSFWKKTTSIFRKKK
ncbi:MAG: hypothetical protein WC135_04060 [Bacteroidales bacterium]